MKISVVTAVYNRKSSIARAMQSVASQSFSAFEHIIIDGGSTDGTLDIIEKMRSSNTTVYSGKDSGIYDAINKGIERATGDVIGLLHSDDLYADDTVLDQVARVFEDETVDIVYADVGFFRAGTPDKILRRYRSSRFAPSRIAWGWMPAHTTLYVRRSVFDRHGLYSTKFRIAGDFEFMARVFRADGHNVSYVPKIWVLMQLGGASTRGLASKVFMNDEVVRACRENGIRTNSLMIWSKYPRKMLEYFRIDRS